MGLAYYDGTMPHSLDSSILGTSGSIKSPLPTSPEEEEIFVEH
jgi:hypothetical protein